MPTLQVPQPLSASAQAISDDTGVPSPILVSTASVGINKTSAPGDPGRPPPPEVALDVGGDLKLEYNGSPKITVYSRGNGTQRYSIRATNDGDPAGGRLLVFRNESAQRDDLVLDSAGNLKLERNGSPKITLYSRGFGTQQYSIRATNNDDNAGGRRFVIRNESQGIDVFAIDSSGDLRVAGDITLPGADCAEQFLVADSDLDPGTVMVIDHDEVLRESTDPYDRHAVGVISGAAARRPAVVLGAGRKGSRRPLALTGTVFCKVDARDSPIAVGDLLVSATSAGHAMKAVDQGRAFGAVLGKALRAQAGGFGMIPILVSLQ